MINFDIKLIAISLSLLVSIIISFVVLRDNIKSITNKTFFIFTICTIFWGIINYLNYQINFPNKQITFLLLRLNLLFGLWQAFFIFKFFLIFPDSNYRKKWWISYLIFPSVIIVSILIFTKYVFSNIIISSIDGYVEKVNNGFGIILFGLLATSLVVSGLIIIYKKYLKYTGIEKTQARLILNGSFLMFSLIIIFNLILPNFFNNSLYVSFSAIYTIPFLILTGYSIVKYHLFNVKIIATELSVFVLWVFILIRTLVAISLQEQIINGSLFFIVVIVGFSLIKSVRKEVEQRERLETLKIKLEQSNLNLEEANEKLKGLDKLKSEFVSLASHQLRSPLTAIKGYASMLVEGDYGEINKEAKDATNRIYESSQNLAKIVEDLLNVSKIEQGGMKYEMAPFDLNEVALSMTKDLLITAENKGLNMTFLSEGAKDCIVNGDQNKIRQVVLNFIDNSIKYTKTGKIKVKVEKINDKVIFSVSDTGMGMTPEIKSTLFHKFARGDGARMNTSGSGLGLYLTKEITEAHGGRVYVESEGIGKGSTFYMELNAVN